MTFNKIMTVSELLRWAYEETQMADGMERLIPDMPEEVQESLRRQVIVLRERSRWLDQQVQYHLELAEKRESRQE